MRPTMEEESRSATGEQQSATEWLGSDSLANEVGRRVGRDTIIYAVASASALVASLISLAVYTHYMKPAVYGKLAILFFFAGSLTILLNLIPLAGILRWVYVAGEADAGAVDDPSRQAPGGTKRRALGTGCWMSAVTIVLGSVVLLPFVHPLAHLMVGRSSAADEIRLAIASGAAGSLYRTTSNVVRMERRPIAFSLVLFARPFLAIAVSIPLVIGGDGIDGALWGTFAGSLVAGIGAWVISRHSYSAEFTWSDFKNISDLGSKYIFVILGLFAVHNGDSFVLSRFGTYAQVGVYRVATRLASLISYLVSSFLLAWAPLERSPLFQATYALKGKTAVHKQLVTYYMLTSLTVMLALTLGGDVIVKLSPPAYSDAANLIPFSAGAFIIYGLFVVIARTTYHRHRDLVHNASAGLGAVIYVAMSAWLIPSIGGYGVAIGAAVGMAFACTCFRALNRTATHHAPIDWPRVLGATAITIGCIGLGRIPLAPVWRIPFLLAVFFVLFPAGLLVTGIVRREEARRLAQLAGSVGAQLLAPVRRSQDDTDTIRALSTLPADDLNLLYALTKDGERPATIAAREHVPVSVIEARAGRAVMRLTNSPGSERDDATIGNLLFSGLGAAEHDIVIYYLEGRGFTVFTLQRVEAAAGRAKAVPRSAWPVADASPLSVGSDMEVQLVGSASDD